MQGVCLIFAGRRGLDEASARWMSARIPQVSQKIKRAQSLIDEVLGDQSSVDLLSYLLSSDQEFLGHPSLRVLMGAVVQVGLFERFIASRPRPEFMLGKTNGISALEVCAGKKSFDELVLKSDFLQPSSTAHSQPPLGEASLVGLQLEEYGGFQWLRDSFEAVDFASKDLYSILAEIRENNFVGQLINIGPSIEFRKKEMASMEFLEFTMMNSIELDPILSSFLSA
ncbi:MAG: hypothetical protein KDD33_10155 [Bdellovibrionales bacterium]|nr:hypothetical protein [Bdellovibrionales bacterium]